jgi:hypothetical protein
MELETVAWGWGEPLLMIWLTTLGVGSIAATVVWRMVPATWRGRKDSLELLNTGFMGDLPI